MGKIISLGKYNKLYKYLWIYVAIRVINEYFFGISFPSQIVIDIFEPNNFPPNIIIQDNFNYIGGLIFSIIFYYYEKKQTKIIHQADKNIKSNESDTSSNSQIEYIHNEYDPTDLSGLSPITVIIPIVLSIVALTAMNIFIIIGLDGLDFWVFDLFFIAYLTKVIFGKPIYGHKKIALLIIIVFSTLFKSLSTFLKINNDENRLIYKDYTIIIPIGILVYILLSLLRSYSLCKIKWLLDDKYLSVSDFLIIYNIVGIILLLIPSLISNFVKCADLEEFNDIDIICSVKIAKENTIEYYFDEYSNFFGKLWKKETNGWLNFLYIILFIIKLFFNFLRLLYSLLIVKHLNPEFYLCPAFIYFFILKLLIVINQIIKNENISAGVLNAIAEAVGILGIMIYLELIELKFLNLNRELRKNIELRAVNEYKINNLIEGNELGSIVGDN